MAQYVGKDRSDEYIDPDYERLKRERNLLRLENKRLNKENIRLTIENSNNSLKITTLNNLVAVIDQFYLQNKTEIMKYLHSIAHKFDDNKESSEDLDENF